MRSKDRNVTHLKKAMQTDCKLLSHSDPEYELVKVDAQTVAF